MATLAELVEKHGVNITVKCVKDGYPAFTIKEVINGHFKVKYGNRECPHLIDNIFSDYELVDIGE